MKTDKDRAKLFCKDKQYLLVFFTLFAVTWFICYLHYQLIHDEGFLLDFEPYYLQSKALQEGHPAPYDVRGTKLGWNLETTLPLFYSLLITPLSFLKLQRAETVFFGFNICFYFLGVFFLIKLITLSREKKILLWCISLIFFPSVHGLVVGNVSIILFVLVTLSLYALKKENFILSAIILGFTASIKITPIFLIAIFFIHKKFKYCFIFILTFLLFQIITSQIAGWENTSYYWLELFPSMNKYSNASTYNQSILGYFTRLHLYFNINFPESINQIVALSILGTFVLFTAYKNKFFKFNDIIFNQGQDNENLFFEICIMLILINLSTPYGWPHHFVWLLVSIAYLLQKINNKCEFKEFDVVLITIAMILFFVPIEDINFANKRLYLLNIIKCGNILIGSLILLFELFKIHSYKN